MDNTLMKLHDTNHNMVIYIQYKFNEIPSFGYIVMSEDKNHRNLGIQRAITPI